ncbi:hypothetical protein [Aeromonas caviae]|uniref:hypothetical protein n=1 Tax=Aeromonas caviae TaxID=648 RepID=UPI001CC6F595|nr:hypothetical protein [Aeromonas caviae]
MELMKANANPVMSTREIAQLVKSNHSDVKRSAERLFTAGLLTSRWLSSHFNTMAMNTPSTG